jgi:hypothetical protein
MLREQEAVGSSPAIGNKNQGSGLVEGHNWGPSEPVCLARSRLGGARYIERGFSHPRRRPADCLKAGAFPIRTGFS